MVISHTHELPVSHANTTHSVNTSNSRATPTNQSTNLCLATIRHKVKRFTLLSHWYDPTSTNQAGYRHSSESVCYGSFLELLSVFSSTEHCLSVVCTQVDQNMRHDL